MSALHRQRLNRTTQALLALACLGACAGQPAQLPKRVVTAEDFASTPRQTTAPGDEAQSSDEEPRTELRQSLLRVGTPTTVTITADDARQGLDDVAVLVGPPVLRPQQHEPGSADQLPEGAAPQLESLGATDVPAARQLASDVVNSMPVDALVGHINGRPLFATEFFEPMDARFRQQAQQLGAQEWLQFAQQQIAIALRDRIRDELLLAELEASMSQQERLGLLAFVQRLRNNLISTNRGSAAVANTRILEAEGITLDQKVLRDRDEELVRYQLQRALGGKTFIAWREVLQQYERDREQYDSPPTARFLVIWAAGDEASRQITTRLITGEAFASVAADTDVNAYPSDAGVYEVPLDAAGYEKTRLFGPDVLDDAALTLQAGKTIGPIQWASSTATREVWIHLAGIEDRSVDLYDVQLAIYDQLFAQRLNEVQAEYFTELISRGSLSNIDDMQQRLFRIAAERYLIATLPARAPDQP